MAFLFNKEEFKKLILSRAKKLFLLNEANEELIRFEQTDKLEYLFFVYKFAETLKEHGIILSLKLDFYPTLLGYILGVDELESIHRYVADLPTANGGFYKTNRFDIYIPKHKKEEAIQLFNDVTPIERDEANPMLYHFGENGKFVIGLYEYAYLEFLNNLDRSIAESIKYNDEEVLAFMLQPDDGGYYMPNLNRCYLTVPSLAYKLINVSSPQSLSDLVIVNNILRSIHNDDELVIKHIKEYGLESIIYSREQLFDLLTNNYDIEGKMVKNIIEGLIYRHRLSESEELILGSNGVPSLIIDQLNNLKYLPSIHRAIMEVEYIYKMAYVKYYYRDDFNRMFKNNTEDTYVGPFFYANNRVYAYTAATDNFDADLRFFDSPMSHFEYFKMLDLYGDYGNYPRGRVIYNNFKRRFFVYLDKDLMTEEIENQIRKAYCLGDSEYKVVFKSDNHYTHDGL